jgi:hypothetical protein
VTYDFSGIDIGAELGQRTILLSPDLVENWRKLFPDDACGDRMPAGMVAIVTMRAYSDIVKPRPAGNVHGAQRFEIHRLPQVGETLLTSVRCVSKEQKKGRNWVQFETLSRADGRLCFSGRQTILWAA